jgi:threonine dehydrogenase-like Zn-dependent dehydrogenase
MELTSHHALHPLPEDLGLDLAAWTLPLANAVDWTLDAGGVGPGSKVAVIGPGYHGLSCVAAAAAGGAERVIALGRAEDTGRLALAEELGAAAEINDDTVVERVREIYGPRAAVVDTIGTPATTATALGLLGRFGVLVLAGLGGGDAALDPTAIVRNLLTVRGVRGRSPQAVRRAIELLDSGTTGLERIPTHSVPLEGVGQALRDMAQGRAPVTPHIVIDPWLRADSTLESLEATR